MHVSAPANLLVLSKSENLYTSLKKGYMHDYPSAYVKGVSDNGIDATS